MTDVNLAKVRSVLERLVENGEAIGSYTVKSEARLTGFSLHVRFENQVDIETSLLAMQIMIEAPGRWSNAMRVILGDEQVTD